MFNPAKRRKTRRQTKEQNVTITVDTAMGATTSSSLGVTTNGEQVPTKEVWLSSPRPTEGDVASVSESKLEVTSVFDDVPPSAPSSKRGSTSHSRGAASIKSLGQAPIFPETTSKIQQPVKENKNSNNKPTEVIDDNNRVWRDYWKEASEEDRDMLDSWNNDMDTLLVFSGLFSAILTAFLLESYQDLKPEPSSAIVLAIQDGFRMSNNISDPVASGPPADGPFIADDRSVRVNAIWFTSLALSITSAAGAMLAKSWLVAYSRQLSIGSMVQRAERRQKRFEGLKRWKFQNTVEFLPFPLFVSLILFGIGLCDFLYGLNHLIATLSTAIFATAFASLIAANLMRPFVSECPYHIPIPITLNTPAITTLEVVSAYLNNTFQDMMEPYILIKNGIIDAANSGSYHPLSALREVPKFLVTLVPLTFVYAVDASVKTLHNLVLLGEKRKLASVQRQNWKANALAWIIQTSTSENALRNAIRLIPAAGSLVGSVNGFGSLCKKEVLDRVIEYFFTSSNEEVLNHAGTPVTESSLEETKAFGRSLRVLCNELLSIHNPSQPTIYYQHVDADALAVRLQSLTFQDPSLRLLKGSTYLCMPGYSYPPWIDDLYWAAEPGSSLDDWLRLFLIRDLGDQNKGYSGRRTEALYLLCGVMRPVTITLESSVIFLCALRNLLLKESWEGYGIFSQRLALGRHETLEDVISTFTSLLETCMNSTISAYHDGAYYLSEDVTSPEQEQLKLHQTLENASVLLFKILHLFPSEVKPNDFIEYPTGTKVFIHWAMKNPNFSIQSCESLPKLIQELHPDYMGELGGDTVRLCFKIISHYGLQTSKGYIMRPAMTLALDILLGMGSEGAKLALELLESDPNAAATILSLFHQDVEALSKIPHFTSFYIIGCHKIDPVNDSTPDDVTFLVREILHKFFDAGLPKTLISKMAQTDLATKDITSALLDSIVLFPSLAKRLISDGEFLAGLISSIDQEQTSRESRFRPEYAGALVQLSYRAREVCTAEERATWLNSLVDLGFPRVYAGLLPRYKNGGVVWDVHCAYPLLQELLQLRRDKAGISMMLDAMEASMVYYEKRDEEIQHPYDDQAPPIRPTDILSNLRELKIAAEHVHQSVLGVNLDQQD